MNADQLSMALDAWRKAFGIIHHYNFPSRQFSLTPDAEFVRRWLSQHGNALPAELVPTKEQFEPVAHMLCSFPATSMNPSALLLRQQKAGKKATSNADVLKLRTLERIAMTRGLEIVPNGFARLRQDLALHRDLMLVTYATELVRRTEFASQGLAVYWLWLQLDADQRKALSTSTVMAAEDRLATWLEKSQNDFLA